MVNLPIRRLAMGLLVTAVCSGTAMAEQIDFQGAVDRALSANPRAQESAARTDAAEAGVRSARGGGLPRLWVGLNAAASNNPLNVFGYHLAQRNATFRDFGLADYTGPGSLGVAPSALNHPGYATNVDTTVAVSVPIYAGGADNARLQAARSRLDASRSRQAMTHDQLVYDVLRTYQGVFAARQMAVAAHKATLAAEAYLKSARALMARGVALRSDVLTAEANLANARSAEQSAAAGVEDALDAFRLTLGAPRSSGLTPARAVDIPPPKGGIDNLEREAIAHSLKLQAMQAQLRAEDADVDIAHAGNRPRVDLTLRHDWNADSPALDGSSNTVLLSVQWDLFSFGAQRGAIERAVGDRRAMAASIKDTEDKMRLEVARRSRDLGTARAREDASRQALRHAAEATRLVKLRYEQGIATLNDLLDSQARLDRARADVTQAHYDALLARGALRLIVHDLDPAAAVYADSAAGDLPEEPQ